MTEVESPDQYGSMIPSSFDSALLTTLQVYFCRGENWGPPCFEYQPELEYTCTELNGKLQKHVGSVFAEPEIICRLAT